MTTHACRDDVEQAQGLPALRRGLHRGPTPARHRSRPSLLYPTDAVHCHDYHPGRFATVYHGSRYQLLYARPPCTASQRTANAAAGRKLHENPGRSAPRSETSKRKNSGETFSCRASGRPTNGISLRAQGFTRRESGAEGRPLSRVGLRMEAVAEPSHGLSWNGSRIENSPSRCPQLQPEDFNSPQPQSGQKNKKRAITSPNRCLFVARGQNPFHRFAGYAFGWPLRCQ